MIPLLLLHLFFVKESLAADEEFRGSFSENVVGDS